MPTEAVMPEQILYIAVQRKGVIFVLYYRYADIDFKGGGGTGRLYLLLQLIKSESGLLTKT